MSLPYPGRYESFNSWDSRCKEWERNQAEWRREQAARSINWGGYNYRPVQKNVEYTMPDGTVVEAVKVTSSFSRGESVRKFAVKNGLAFKQVSWGHGMTARTDNVAFKPTNTMLEVYNQD
jgi:hypothetical protein